MRTRYEINMESRTVLCVRRFESGAGESSSRPIPSNWEGSYDRAGTLVYTEDALEAPLLSIDSFSGDYDRPTDYEYQSESPYWDDFYDEDYYSYNGPQIGDLDGSGWD